MGLFLWGSFAGLPSSTNAQSRLETSVSQHIRQIRRDLPRENAPRARAVTGDERWGREFGLPVVDGWVYCAAEYQGKIIIGGSFSRTGDVVTRNLAVWDGSAWSPLGEGTDGAVYALTIFNGQMVLGGTFSSAGGLSASGVAAWNGAEYAAMGAGLREGTYQQPDVWCLSTYRGSLVAAGGFTQSGTTSVRHVALWDGGAWAPLGQGINGGVYALAAIGDSLFAGGAFDSAGTVAVHSLACWDGATWQDVDGGVGPYEAGRVYALAVDSGNLFVGGSFESAGGLASPNLARWTGSSWVPIGLNAFLGARHLATHQGTVFIGSGFNSDALATWNPGSGLRWVGDIVGSTSCLFDLGDDLLVAGRFGASGPSGIRGFNVLRWADGSWEPFEAWGGAMRGLISGAYYAPSRAITSFQGRLASVGVLAWAGDPPNWAPLGKNASWDRSEWTAMPSVLGYPADMAARDDTLYVAGVMGSDYEANSPVARLVGSSWSKMDTLSLDARCIAFFQGDLYIGGWRLGIGTPRTGGVYRWDGSRWETIGLADGTMEFPGVLAMTVHDGRLVVGGWFDTIGRTPAVNVAAWDGHDWLPLGAGLPSNGENAVVYALASHEGAIFAGGDFDTWGYAMNRWNGVEWEPKPLTGFPSCLSTFEGNLFVGGLFFRNDGQVDGILAWTGQDWVPLGSGVNWDVWDMATVDDNLYIIGAFTEAGGHGSFGIARYGPETPLAPMLRSTLAPGTPNPFRDSVMFSIASASDGMMRVRVVDVLGREVAVLYEGHQTSGPHSFQWNGRSGSGGTVPAGIYFLHVTYPDGTSRTQKIVRLR
ncbi:MAG: FlgD immunoglobulin-like domain containing protein [Candidatus Eisenbacteria bacterium]|mgnify:CR=1 FL=1